MYYRNSRGWNKRLAITSNRAQADKRLHRHPVLELTLLDITESPIVLVAGLRLSRAQAPAGSRYLEPVYMSETHMRENFLDWNADLTSGMSSLSREVLCCCIIHTSRFKAAFRGSDD